MLNEAVLKMMGAEHAKSGKSCTPFDCREIDEKIFSESRGMETGMRMKKYNILRGAFNKGWEEEYCKIVGI